MPKQFSSGVSPRLSIEEGAKQFLEGHIGWVDATRYHKVPKEEIPRAEIPVFEFLIRLQDALASVSQPIPHGQKRAIEVASSLREISLHMLAMLSETNEYDYLHLVVPTSNIDTPKQLRSLPRVLKDARKTLLENGIPDNNRIITGLDELSALYDKTLGKALLQDKSQGPAR